ncbi:proline-rich transmembrane protein 3 [Excalfactoria chinensis]|uniref:proline-rich transmembrane protein 3 n=1 Tax=Excalfactoria chinensis TaxID=46218 RepID=UPI003B3B53BB
MAAAWLITWALLLAHRVPTMAQGTLPLDETSQQGRVPSWGHVGTPLAWDASGELSGAEDIESERWRSGSSVRWSQLPHLGTVTRTPRVPGRSLAGDTTLAVVEEPFITWQGREAKGQDSPRGTQQPHSSTPGMPSPQLPTDTGPPWAGQGTVPSEQSVSMPGSAPSPQPTVSTVALTPEPAVGTRVVTAAMSTWGQPAAAGSSKQGLWGPLSTAPASTLGEHSAPSHGPSPKTAQEVRAETWTWLLPAHQRSTRRAPLSNATTGDMAPARSTRLRDPQPTLSTSITPLPTSSGSPPGTPHTGLLPEQDVGSPQRVRGAVGHGSTPNATEVTVPTVRPTAGTLSGTRRSDTAGTQPPAASSTAVPSSTWRQGVVRATTQRAARRPVKPEPSEPPTEPSACTGAPCAAESSNTTAAGWAELRRPLRIAWAAHAYVGAALCLLLALGCIAGLGGTVLQRPPHCALLLGAMGLLLAASLLRGTFLLLDPYGARGRLPPRCVLLLCSAPFTLLLGAFALLLGRLQRTAQLCLLPPSLGGLPALGVTAVLQCAAPAAADLLWPRWGLGAGLALHGLGCAFAALLLLGGLRGGWRGSRREGPRCGARALLAAGLLGVPCCALQLLSAAWLRGGVGPAGRCGWPCWAAMGWMRVGEAGAGLAVLLGAAEPLRRARREEAAGHSCWAKAVRYFCAGRKARAPEYPNNCYEHAPTGDISKSLIRNPAEQLPLRALKDSNAAVAAGTPGLSPKCPNVAAAALRERGSSASLGELVFRPPSPIDLRRSIDQALCRRHLLREGLFGRPRRGSGASIRTFEPQTALARCSSLTELPRGEADVSVSSMESFSLKISWNPWRHGLSSPDSLPLEEAPSRAQLLAHQETPPALQPPGSEPEARRSFLALSRQVDARSLSSDTIEL